MALLRIDHVPESIKMNIPLDIILPDPGRMEDIPVRRRKVLYLLHGLGDDASAWQRYSTIETLAMAYGLVVVMPSAGRSFYTDQPNGQAYFNYLAFELPRYLDDVFHLSPKRKDTLLAGLSMGGYGAFKLAFHYPERFKAAASFSGVLSLVVLRALPNDPRLPEFKTLFGDLNRLDGSEHDPAVWFKRAAAQKVRLPRLYIACGRQDDMYPVNLFTRSSLQELGIDVDYYEGDARHDWFFWDAQIRRFLAAELGPVPVK
jgi:putative tributyrin esterase